MYPFQEKGKDIFKQFGLVDGHAFAVTGVKQVFTPHLMFTPVCLFKLYTYMYVLFGVYLTGRE